MSISYPLTPPSSPSVTSVNWYERQAVALTESPYSFDYQIHNFGGQRWEIEVSIDQMSRAEAQAWIAFLSSLKGPIGTFYFGDVLFSAPILGTTGVGTPTVSGASQTGATLSTAGWTAATKVLSAGDMFSVQNKVHRVLKDVTSSGGGAATIDIWPNAKAPTDGYSLVLSGWKGIFRLVDDSQPVMVCNANRLHSIDFKAVEVL